MISLFALQFYVIAKEEIERLNTKFLLKCFLPRKKNAFDNECKVLKSLPHGANRSDIPFLQWHTKGEQILFCIFYGKGKH